MPRACLIILDSLGVGGAPDAARYGDAGADTLGHIALACVGDSRGPLGLPYLRGLGLGLAAATSTGRVPPGLEPGGPVRARYGSAMEISLGKDTPTGHFELTGVPVMEEWGYFQDAEQSMPRELVARLVREAGLPGVLGNCKASGTEILTRLGAEHIRTGCPIIYTSADSVLQIAAHETHFGLGRLLHVCGVARRLTNPWRIARIIARPFVGESSESFRRTGNRHDYGVPAPGRTVLDQVCAAGGSVICVGKVADIFAHRGVSHSIRAHGPDPLLEETLSALNKAGEKSLIITNFVDFDTVHGHRRDVFGYARALESLDRRLPELEAALEPGDVCILTADHGCDPTWIGTDHTREQVPVLAFGPGIMPGCIGCRQTLADVGATLTDFLGVPGTGYGTPFLDSNPLPEDGIPV